MSTIAVSKNNYAVKGNNAKRGSLGECSYDRIRTSLCERKRKCLYSVPFNEIRNRGTASNGRIKYKQSGELTEW